SDDRDYVHFLYAELANAERAAVSREHSIRALDLPREKETWCGIQPGTGHARHRVGPTRAGGYQGDSQIVGRFAVVLRGNGARLLVRIADRFDSRTVSHRLVQVHGAAAGDEKDVLHPLICHKTNHVVRKLFHPSQFRPDPRCWWRRNGAHPGAADLPGPRNSSYPNSLRRARGDRTDSASKSRQ